MGENYKLYYFDCRNLGEMIRMILHYAKVPFQDIRISNAEWPELKESHSFKHLPVLEEDGNFLTQSTAIARYLGRKYDLAGQNEWDNAKVDEFTDYQADIYEQLKPYYFSALGISRADEKEKLYTEVFKPIFPGYLKRIEKTLASNSTGYLVGTKETFIDFWVADYLFTWQQLEPRFFKRAQGQSLVRYVRQIHSLPRLEKYIQTRPAGFLNF